MSRTKRTPVTPVRVEQECTECWVGTLIPTGVNLMSNPPRFEHACTECGHKERFSVRHPYIEYVEVK